MLKEYLADFTSLIYPQLCASCGLGLYKGEEVICTFCHHYLPKTYYHLERNNAIEKHFWGRVNIERAASCYFFQRGSRVQHLIHQLKYKGKTEVGVAIGKIYGNDLNHSVDYCTVDVIVPVPLHKSKEMKRGYNQVDLFCEGMAETMNKPWSKHALERLKATETQTHKTRFERWENVGTVFHITNPDSLKGKHVMLADDVITTGSTLEACAQAILAVSDTRVSVATIACAVM
ncbi:MAG: ComF family protein [Chitinophagales bacterium]|nr:ComF family protein [Chitinophagales bacterium]